METICLGKSRPEETFPQRQGGKGTGRATPPLRDGGDSFSSGSASQPASQPSPTPQLSRLAWDGCGAGTKGFWATAPAPWPELHQEGQKGGGEGRREGASSHPPPQALIETINQTQKYYARPGSEGEMVGCHGNPGSSIPMVGGGKGALSWSFSRNVLVSCAPTYLPWRLSSPQPTGGPGPTHVCGCFCGGRAGRGAPRSPRPLPRPGGCGCSGS